MSSRVKRRDRESVQRRKSEGSGIKMIESRRQNKIEKKR
jgi:hypothetical protein